MNRIVRAVTWYPLMVAGILGGFLMIPVLVYETARNEGIFQALGVLLVSTGYQTVFALLILSPIFVLLTILGIWPPN
jgi:hypothetical protein